MNSKSPKDIIQISFKLYKILGETFDGSPSDNPTKLIIFRCFSCMVLFLNSILAIANFRQVQGEMYIKSLEDTLSILHNFIKYVSILYYKEDIIKLINDMKYFWNYQRCGPNVYANINKIHTTIMKCQKVMLFGPVCVLTIYCLKPLFNKKFIFYIWSPWDSQILDILVLLSQYYLTAIMTPIVFGCDFLYLAYSVHLASQTYLLNRELESLQEKDSNADIYEYIKHHQLMLSVFNRMKNIFFWLLLFHYFVSLFSGCSEMYLIILGKSKPLDLLAIGMYLCCIFVEFAYYSFLVEIIVSELQYISTSIYMSPWYQMNSTRKRLLLFMMVRAQRQSYLSIGGFMDMNVDAFGSVVRKVFSFLAILRNILN